MYIDTTLLSSEVKRPSRLTKKKDEVYDINYAIDILENKLNRAHMQNFYIRNLVNEAFYKGNQWIFDEDLDGFLMDENGDARNRIKFVQNIIKPYIEQFRGYAIKMSVEARAIATSPHALNRRMEKINEIESIHEYMQEHEYAQAALMKRYNVKGTLAETMDDFNALYSDRYADNINALMRRVAANNDFEDKKKAIATNIALCGVGIIFEDDRINEQVFKVVRPNQWFYDTNAQRDDLLDAEFMGVVEFETFSSIVEAHQHLSIEEKEILENIDEIGGGNFPHVTGNPVNSFQKGRIPVYKIYWDDIEVREVGCVIENGMYCLRYINEDGSDFTDKDVVEPPDGFYEDFLENKNKPKGKRNKSNTVTVDCTRFCHFVYGDFIGHSDGHIILKSGKRKFANTYSFRNEFNDKGFKCYAWSYVGGDLLSCVDDIIDIQRYINRLNSVAEAQTNNARGSGMVYDKDMVTDEAEFLRNVNAGKPVGVEANGQLNNRISNYDNTLKNGTIIIHNIAQTMKSIAMDSFGGAALQGVGDGVRVSVGAVQQNLNQAIIMQEPFFYCLSKVMMQCYQSIASRGKKIYAHTGEVLMDTVGDIGNRMFVITEEDENEQYNVEILRSEDAVTSRRDADSVLMMMAQAQIIDQDTMAKYYGTIPASDIGMVIREYRMKALAASREAAKQQAIQVQGATELQQAEVDQMAVDKERAYDEQNSANQNTNLLKLQDALLKHGAQQQRNQQASKK